MTAGGLAVAACPLVAPDADAGPLGAVAVEVVPAASADDPAPLSWSVLPVPPAPVGAAAPVWPLPLGPPDGDVVP